MAVLGEVEIPDKGSKAVLDLGVNPFPEAVAVVDPVVLERVRNDGPHEGVFPPFSYSAKIHAGRVPR